MFSKFVNRIILVCVLQTFLVNCHLNTSSRTTNKRQKRTLNFYFPYNSCYALAVVMVLPLEDLPAGQSVFCSYNFEANFYYPYFDNTAGIVPIPFTWIDEPGANAGTKHRIDLPPAYRQFNDHGEEKQIERNDTKVDSKVKEIQTLGANVESHTVTKKINKQATKSTVKKGKSRKVRTLLDNYFMSRRRFYKLMESEIDRSGLQGRDCMLKAICETSETTFGLNNGVVGSVVDVLFLPSASKDEKLPQRYYQAEINGRSGACDLYNKKCPRSIFDFISKII